jgi:hypothetical protein
VTLSKAPYVIVNIRDTADRKIDEAIFSSEFGSRDSSVPGEEQLAAIPGGL